MKTILAITACTALAVSAQAQHLKETDVPAVVKTAFTKAHPGSKAEKWEKEGDNFEVEFMDHKTETSLLIDKTGNVLETEAEIASESLPAATKEYISKNLAGKKIKEAAKITDHKGVVTYEAEVDKADYVFDAEGKFIKKEGEK